MYVRSSHLEMKIAVLSIHVNVIDTFLRGIVCKISTLSLYMINIYIRVSIEIVIIQSSCFSCVFYAKIKKMIMLIKLNTIFATLWFA